MADQPENIADQPENNGMSIANMFHYANVGVQYATRNYGLIIDGSKSTAVNLIDKTRTSAWIGSMLRIDRPHRNVAYNHVNINSRYSGVPDPHIPISSTTLEGAKVVGKTLKAIDTCMQVAVIGAETVKIGQSAYNDYQCGTTRNTATTISYMVGAWGGSLTGSAIGATVGSAILPVIGTVVGGVVGGASGAIAGAIGTEATVLKIADIYNYDMERYRCQKCDTPFVCRKYTNQSRVACGYSSCHMIHSLYSSFSVFEN